MLKKVTLKQLKSFRFCMR